MMDRIYTVKTLDSRPDDWSAIPKASIDQHKWIKKYMPTAYAQLVMVRGFGFLLRMVCYETQPKAVYHNYNDPVYLDSCLEFFAAWKNDDPRYVNMEMNSFGTLLACIGEERNNRIPIADLTGGKIFSVTGEVGPTYWSVTAEIPFSRIKELYGVGEETFVSGYRFRGNFYKCGDETEFPHYGAWSRVEAEQPDFHRPEFFGTLVIS